MNGPTLQLMNWLTQAPPGEALIEVLELQHPSWVQGFVISNWHAPVQVVFETGRAVTPLPIAFRVDMPDAGLQGRQDMQIAIDNVGGELWNALEQAITQAQFPIAVAYRLYTSKVLTAPQAVPVSLTVTSIAATHQAVQLTAERSDLINRKWPTVVYRAERWPGLVR
jgi:hypothetical protein